MNRFAFPLLLHLTLLLAVQVLSKTDYHKLFEGNPSYISDGFDFPVGPPDANGYYNAQGFGKNHHLGDDWNGTGGGNSDLGDPIYSIANGYVTSTYHHGIGWGNVIRVVHYMKDENRFVESLYAHCNEMTIESGDWVKRGQKIGTIGNAEGAYWAHLHLEIRTNVDMGLGGGYSEETNGYTDPTAFINNHRPN